VIAVVHACAQNEDDMMACKGVGCKRKEGEEKSDRKEVGWVRGE